MGDRRWLVVFMALAGAAASIHLVAALDGRAPFEAAAVVPVVDPVDGWLGGEPRIDGDVALATTVLIDGTSVAIDGTALRFASTGPGRAEAELGLRDVLSAYEQARRELRAGLDRRLEMVPALTAFAAQRTAALDLELAQIELALSGGQGEEISALRAERAATIAAASDYRDRRLALVDLPRTTLAPAWSLTPVEQRLARLDELLSTAFWYAAGDR